MPDEQLTPVAPHKPDYTFSEPNPFDERETPKYTRDQIKGLLDQQGVAGIVEIIKKEEGYTDEQIIDFMRDFNPDYEVKPSEGQTVSSYFDHRIKSFENAMQVDTHGEREAKNDARRFSYSQHYELVKTSRDEIKALQTGWKKGEIADAVEHWFKTEQYYGLEGVTNILNADPIKEGWLKDRFGPVNWKTKGLIDNSWRYMSAGRLLKSEIAPRMAQNTPPITPL